MIKKTLFNGVFDGLIIVLIIIVATFTIYILTDNQDVNNMTHLAPVNEDIDTVKSEDVKMEDAEDVNDAIVYESKPKDSNIEPETDTTEIISDDTVEVVEADIIEPLVEHELTDTGIDWEAAKPVGNGYTGITLASELPDKIIDSFVWHINKEYANHPIPELRRYAELSPKIFRGEPLNLNEMYDFVKAMYIVNPTDATLKELEKYEKRLLAQTFERQRTR